MKKLFLVAVLGLGLFSTTIAQDKNMKSDKKEMKSEKKMDMGKDKKMDKKGNAETKKDQKGK